MARAEVKMPNQIIDELTRLGGDLDHLAEETLKAGAAVVAPKLAANLAGAIGRDTKSPSRSTGLLASALGVTPVKTGRAGDHNLKVGFAENRSDGKSNALVANVLEYGRSNQAARPFLAPTRSQTRTACIEAMKTRLTALIDEELPK